MNNETPNIDDLLQVVPEAMLRGYEKTTLKGKQTLREVNKTYMKLTLYEKLFQLLSKLRLFLILLFWIPPIIFYLTVTFSEDPKDFNTLVYAVYLFFLFVLVPLVFAILAYVLFIEFRSYVRNSIHEYGLTMACFRARVEKIKECANGVSLNMIHLDLKPIDMLLVTLAKDVVRCEIKLNQVSRRLNNEDFGSLQFLIAKATGQEINNEIRDAFNEKVMKYALFNDTWTAFHAFGLCVSKDGIFKKANSASQL